MRKLARRLSGSSSGGRSSKRLDVASLNRGFDEVDGPEKGKSNKRPATSEPTSPSGRPTAWGERLPAEELAAVKMQAAARGKRARKSMGSRKGLGVIGELEEEPTPSDSPIASAAGAFAAFLKQPVAAVDAATTSLELVGQPRRHDDVLRERAQQVRRARPRAEVPTAASQLKLLTYSPRHAYHRGPHSAGG